MLTADLALRFEPIYEKIARHFLEHPEEFRQAFAKAWFKLTHRDMGPKIRYIGPEVPEEEFLWQDLLPSGNYELIDEKDIKEIKKKNSFLWIIRFRTCIYRMVLCSNF